jgi:hypothetical protein
MVVSEYRESSWHHRVRDYIDPDVPYARDAWIETIRRAARAYHSADAWLEEVRELRLHARRPGDQECDSDDPADQEEHRQWDLIERVVGQARDDAERSLMASILASAGRMTAAAQIDQLKGQWKPCGIVVDDLIYIVHPERDDAPQARLLIMGDADMDNVKFLD